MSKKHKLRKQKRDVQDDYDDIFEDKEPELPIIKKKSNIQQQTNQTPSEAIRSQDQANYIRCPIENINIEQVSILLT